MDTTTVNVGDCRCPEAPHADGDEVQLRTKLDLAGGVLLQGVIVEANGKGDNASEITAQLAGAYLRVGVVAWNLVDVTGAPIPVTPDTIARELADDFERALPVADKADELYMQAVIGPLVARASKSSSTTSTNGSTSATRRGPRKAPKRSRPSSTSTSETAVTVTTSA